LGQRDGIASDRPKAAVIDQPGMESTYVASLGVRSDWDFYVQIAIGEVNEAMLDWERGGECGNSRFVHEALLTGG
jgi:hypothetical protein